jgi:cytochrome c peroxidase
MRPKSWPEPSYNFKRNPVSPEKVALGRTLFYDPLLSSNGKISCASCHSPFNAFTHADHALSHGIDDRIGKRNSPALMNLAWQQSFMWDGSVNHLDMQALAPISNPDEMNESIANVVRKLQEKSQYRQDFRSAFGDSAITGERTLLALSQFMLTLVSSESRYDSVQRGESKFTQQESNGYHIFKKNCSSCHTEPLFTTHSFANNGLPVDPKLQDKGRYSVTHKSADSLKFKIPTLRNLSYSFPYMHDGRFRTLSMVIDHYRSGIAGSNTLAPQLRSGITIDGKEKIDLIAFLLTLNDKSFIFNRQHSYPQKK